MRRSIIPVGASLLLIGCAMVTGVDEERVVGQIGYPDRVVIESPTTVKVGQSFDITVQTYGPDGCWSDDGTTVSISGLSATVTPFDRKSGELCTHAPVEITHVASLTFNQPGEAQITIKGRDGTVERSVYVE